MSRGSYNRHPEYYSKPVNVKVTTVNDFDADGKPRQIVTVETVDPDKEKREAKQKLRAMREQQLKEWFEKYQIEKYVWKPFVYIVCTLFVLCVSGLLIAHFFFGLQF